jgi:hypothetical protein
MPFLLYEIANGIYRRLHSVHLGGKSCPFKKAAERTPESPEWDITGSELLRLLEVQDEDRHAVVIDLKPNAESVNLYRIRHVWGYFSQKWTPIALELEGVLEKEKEELKEGAPPKRSRESSRFHRNLEVRSMSSCTSGKIDTPEIGIGVLWVPSTLPSCGPMSSIRSSGGSTGNGKTWVAFHP